MTILRHLVLALVLALAARLVAPAHAAPAAAPPPFAVQVSGQGRPILFIPGLASSGAVWDGAVAHYRARYACHVVTLAGFAGQPRVDGPFLDTMRRELAAYIRRSHLVKPVVVGHSLGGLLALELAAAEPDLVGRVVIVDSYPFLAALWDPHATVESARQMADKMRLMMQAQDEAGYRQQLEQRTAPSMVTAPADQKRVVEWGMASDRRAVGDAFVEVMTTDLRGQLGRITAPTLVVAATRGTSFTPADVDKGLHAQYHDLRGVRFAPVDARHFVMLDNSAALFEAMDGFLNGK